MSISQPVYEAQIERISGQEERITELEAELADVKDELAKAKNVPAKMRFIACGYCGEKLHEYQDNDPSPSEHREALQKFRAHDARCDANPIKRERCETSGPTSGLMLWHSTMPYGIRQR